MKSVILQQKILLKNVFFKLEKLLKSVVLPMRCICCKRAMCCISNRYKKRPTAFVDAVSPLVLESVISFSECYWAVAHARGRSEGGQSRRED